mmetsp:Transcript_49582/g.125985  ORF Transcript_49582/g.125985 Transcript_49582/m.125985 type:complete len:119 (-) Transcript_49582:1066-1422(-)
MSRLSTDAQPESPMVHVRTLRLRKLSSLHGPRDPFGIIVQARAVMQNHHPRPSTREVHHQTADGAAMQPASKCHSWLGQVKTKYALTHAQTATDTAKDANTRAQQSHLTILNHVRKIT